MVAPSKQGEYTGFWMLRSANGARFGVGKDAQFSFWVKIKVVEGPYEVFSFAENKCSAVWSSGSSNPLACPGKETDIISGYVLSKDHPYRESGALENEIGLITRPNNSSDGWIQGIYPAYKVKEGDVFKAAVNCEYGSSHCDVYFELRYRIAGGDIHTLGSWHEIYEGLWKNVSVDLSSLVGKDVQFILFVKNGATAQDNKALWIRPSIWRD
jgi:hypothetical protein